MLQNGKVLLMVLSVLVHSLGMAESGSHASIKSKYGGQLVTSSTLKWRPFNSGGGELEGAVPSGTGGKKQVICRAEHHGSLLIGILRPGFAKCIVSFVNKTFKKQKFEVLINVDRAARLEWRSYNKFSGVPEGTVAGIDDDNSAGSTYIFIGRHLSSESGKYLPGIVEVPRSAYSFGTMRVWDQSGRVEEHSNGDVLVELEPERYELEIHPSTSNNNHLDKFVGRRRQQQLRRRKPRITREDIVLAKSSLFRFDGGRDEVARLVKVLSYKYDTSVYYGQIPGMVRALPSTVHLNGGQVQSVLWGLPKVSREEGTVMVGHELRHFSAIDVSIVGVQVTEEQVYEATLTTIFPDGSRHIRKVEGVLQKQYLNNIRPEYSRVYMIKDATTATTTTTTTTTTTKDRMLADQQESSAAILLQDSNSVSTWSCNLNILIFSFFLARFNNCHLSMAVRGG